MVNVVGSKVVAVESCTCHMLLLLHTLLANGCLALCVIALSLVAQ